MLRLLCTGFLLLPNTFPYFYIFFQLMMLPAISTTTPTWSFLHYWHWTHTLYQLTRYVCIFVFFSSLFPFSYSFLLILLFHAIHTHKYRLGILFPYLSSLNTWPTLLGAKLFELMPTFSTPPLRTHLWLTCTQMRFSLSRCVSFCTLMERTDSSEDNDRFSRRFVVDSLR